MIRLARQGDIEETVKLDHTAQLRVGRIGEILLEGLC